jgi:hypothetical protein
MLEINWWIKSKMYVKATKGGTEADLVAGFGGLFLI